MREFLGVTHNMKCIRQKEKMKYLNTECTWSHYFLAVSSLWQKQQAVWFETRMVYSNVSCKHLFLSLNDILMLATVKTTIVYKTSNNDNFDR